MTCRFDLYWIDDFHSPSFVWEKLFAGLASPVGFISIFRAADVFLFYLFKIMTCSRNWLGVGVTAVILADISADTVCSAGGFCRHRAFVVVSEWIGCSAANCTSLSACASCRSTPIMFIAWIRKIPTTFLAISRPLMKLRVKIFIVTIVYSYPFTTNIAVGFICIYRCWQHH